MEPLVLVGGGGHASDVLQAIEAHNAVEARYRVVGILDDGPVDPRRFAGRGVEHLGPVELVGSLDAAYVLCVGWPWAREALLGRIGPTAPPAAPIVHPGADLGASVELGAGSVVLGGAHLSPMVRMGAHGLVSYNATVGHDTVFGELASVMPGANVSGDVTAGDAVLVGTGAVVLEGLRLGDRARIGAGAVVTRDVPAGTTVVGVPAAPVDAGGPGAWGPDR
jgi:sugar O-acyltransferase (sialic acid O-acetyltransferase NeuD family)